MSALGIVAIGLLGWFVGAAVWVHALGRVRDRSRIAGPVCTNPDCGAVLPAQAWLPLAGFGTARRCPACGTAVSGHRFGFEAIVAAYYALVAIRWGDDDRLWMLAVLVFAVPLLMVLLIDAWTRFVHLDVIVAGLLAGTVFAALDGVAALLNAVASAAGAVAVFAVFFIVAMLIYRNLRVVPFGLGDVYLAAMIGMMTRYPDVVQALFAGIFLAGLGSIVLLLTRRVGRRDPIPYGPYLCIGALLTLVA